MILGELFDPKADFMIDARLRPHWSQAGAIVFITARTADSIPREVFTRWECEKHAWLDRLEQQLGRPVRRGRHWKAVIEELDVTQRRDFAKCFNRQREVQLDRCHGLCWLRVPEYAQIVADSLLHFDGKRYRMGDFVIMPNHLHLLAAFSDPKSMAAQIDSWLHWTATQINRKTGCHGHFWQQEPFDHLVRSVEQYVYLRQYIADNPRKARLRAGEYIYRRLAE
jgi:putative transposase